MRRALTALGALSIHAIEGSRGMFFVEEYADPVKHKRLCESIAEHVHPRSHKAAFDALCKPGIRHGFAVVNLTGFDKRVEHEDRIVGKRNGVWFWYRRVFEAYRQAAEINNARPACAHLVPSADGKCSDGWKLCVHVYADTQVALHAPQWQGGGTHTYRDEPPEQLLPEFGELRGWVPEREMTAMEIAKGKPAVAKGA